MKSGRMSVVLAGCLLAGLSLIPNLGRADSTNIITCNMTLGPDPVGLAITLTRARTWDMGVVLLGSVIDTWYSGADATHRGPGAFEVQNQGAPCSVRIETGNADNVDGAGVGGPNPPSPVLPAPASSYALAFASNVTDPVPVWRLLDQQISSPLTIRAPCYRVLTPSLYGQESLAFDLRFYAPYGLQSGIRSFKVTLVAIGL